MDHARRLKVAVETDPFAANCPDCSAAASQLRPLCPTQLESTPLRRCYRCGGRSTCESEPRRVIGCRACRLFFLEGPDASDRCPRCLDEGVAPEPPEASMIGATETEVCNALAESWEFVGSSASASYLRRVLAGLARHIEGLPATARVLLIRQSAVRCLALPSGTVILSTGALAALENEAELAFLLGHELAHVVSGDAAVGLVRTCLRGMAQQRPEQESVWFDAAVDLLWLGHGDRAELDADATSLKAVASAGYDTGAAQRMLQRIDERAGRGDADVAELYLAHPRPADRIGRLESLSNLSLTNTGQMRVDREVFRRAAGHSVLSAELEVVAPFEETGNDGAVRRLARSKLFWVAVGLAVVAGLLVFWGVV